MKGSEKKRRYVTLTELMESIGYKGKRSSMLTSLIRNRIPYRKDYIISLEDLDKSARRVSGILPSEAILRGVNLLTCNEYAAKYQLSHRKVYFYWLRGKIDGFVLFHKLFLVDAPPRMDYEYIYSDDEVWRRVETYVEKHLIRPIGLVKVSPKQLGRRALKLLAQKGMLFRFGRFYYILYDKLKRSFAEIKLLYPSPLEIMVPKPLRDYTWNDAIQVDDTALD